MSDDEASERLARIGHASASAPRCPSHPPVASDALMQLALVGSRASAFHHDCASKLQGLVMALDELTELTENGDPQLIRAIEAALDSTRELNNLLNLNRALTKAPARAPIRLGELVAAAARRVSITVHGALPDASLLVAVPAATHALALAFDVAGGVGRGRQLAISAELTEGAQRSATLLLPLTPPAPSSASELLAIVSFALTRDGGAAWCADDGSKLMLRLPAA